MRDRSAVALLCLCVCFSVHTASPVFSAETIPFGLCPKYNPRIMYQLYQPFVDYLSENTPYRFEIRLSRIYQDTIERIGGRELQIASCGPVPYVQASERYPVRPILRPLNKDGKPYYRGIVVVRQNSPIQHLADLKGKRFAFGPAWSTAGFTVPMYDLKRAGIGLKDLGGYAFLRHHDSVVNAVLKGKFDAGAVKDVVARQYRHEGVRFIHHTDPIPTVPIIIHRTAPKALVMSVKAALLKLNPRDPNHSKRMEEWDEEFKYGFIEAVDSDYDEIRKILRSIPIDSGEKGALRE
ncbi:MAG: phosphate/phosphite/phosphonate ABC transporter substrate-binding protein [Thermodesulfobacteriota bacterium]